MSKEKREAGWQFERLSAVGCSSKKLKLCKVLRYFCLRLHYIFGSIEGRLKC